MFYQARMLPPPQSEENQFLSATIVPPVPQSTQSGAEVIDQMNIFRLSAARELLLQGILMQIISAK